MPILTPQEIADLQQLLNTKDGIFQNVSTNAGFIALNTSFETERNRIHSLGRNISFSIPPLSIPDLLLGIDQIVQEPNGSLFTHLEFLYGLEQSSGTSPATIQMSLTMTGVKLNANNATSNPVSTHRFVFPGAAVNEERIQLFNNVFSTLHSQNFIKGAYIKITAFRQQLNNFLTQNCNRLQITFGFMKPVPAGPGISIANNRNCFHLIFRGVRSDGSLSADTFSTFDNEAGYSGPKPSTPPFTR